MAILLRVAFIVAAGYGIWLFLRWYERNAKQKERNQKWNDQIDKWDQDRKIRQNQKEIEKLKDELKNRGKQD